MTSEKYNTFIQKHKLVFSQMFPQAVWEYLLYFKPSLKNMTVQMGFAFIEYKVSTVNLHTSVSHGLQ